MCRAGHLRTEETAYIVMSHGEWLVQCNVCKALWAAGGGGRRSHEERGREAAVLDAEVALLELRAWMLAPAQVGRLGTSELG